jgi:hypothetical protein
MQSGKTWWELQTVCAMSDMSFNQVGAQTMVGEFYGWLIGSNISSVNPYQIAQL